MDNEKNDALNEKVQQAKDDVEAKIADAASEIKEEIAEADAAAKEAAAQTEDAVPEEAEEVKEDVPEETEESEEAAKEVTAEPVSEPQPKPKKPKKNVSISLGALIAIVVGSLAVAALVVFLVMNHIQDQPKYGKAEGKTVATVNGEKLTDADLGYYIYTEATNQYYTVEGDNADGELENYDWDKDVNGRKLSDIIKENAYNTAVGDLITSQKASEVLTGDTVWDEQDDQQIQTTVDGYVQQFGEDGFNLRAKSMGVSSVNEYARIYTMVMKSQEVRSEIEEDFDSFVPEGVNLSDYVQDDKGSVKHILLTVSDTSTLDPAATPDPEAYDDATAAQLAQTISDQAKAGEDFDSLMTQYNQDTGETSAGYTFGTGEMVKEFEDAAFALGIDEISGPVKTDYGYHVIKRIAGFYELQNYWKSQAKISEKKSVLDKISVKGIMDGVYQSGTQLQEEEEAAQEASQSDSESGSESDTESETENAGTSGEDASAGE